MTNDEMGDGVGSVDPSYAIGEFAMMAISATTTVRELLRAHPGVFDVLAGHGMCADCAADPPPVPLGHFAKKHCGGDLEGLIAELHRVIAAGPGR